MKPTFASRPTPDQVQTFCKNALRFCASAVRTNDPERRRVAVALFNAEPGRCAKEVEAVLHVLAKEEDALKRKQAELRRIRDLVTGTWQLIEHARKHPTQATHDVVGPEGYEWPDDLNRLPS